MATEDELKRAFKAFKKRIKLARLDDASGLGRGGSKRSSIAAITPPKEFPAAVWDDLVTQGKLKSEGHGMYSLAQEL